MSKEISKPKKIKWGVAGCGRFTENSFIPTAKLLRRSIVTSVFSKNAERAKNISQKFGIENHFSNYDDFLKTDINTIYIGSNNADHYHQVIKAAEAGKHIFCEKPVALNSKQAEEMVEACNKNNVQFAVNYLHRFHPLAVKAKELIKDQKLGKLVSINLNFNINLAPSSNFRFKKEVSGGGALRDLGTHMIDLLRYFGGEIMYIKGMIDNLVYQSEVDDFSLGVAKFKKEGYGVFNVSFNTIRSFNRIEILCHKGAISIENLIGRKLLGPKLTILLEGETKKSFRKRGNKLLYVLRSVQKSFINNETPQVTGEDGLINLKLMEELEGECIFGKN